MASPLAPLLTSPRTLQHMASGGTIRLAWVYQHPEAGKTQAKVAVRRKELPSGSYEYWNGATWVGGETYVVCTTEYIDINSGWTANKKYQWTVRVQDSATTNGPYATDMVFICIATPTVTVLQPTGAPAVSRPPVTWEYSQAQGYQQLKYRVAVYTAAQYGIGGFTAFTSPSTWETDWKTSTTAWSEDLGFDVTSGTTYKAYVQVETEGGLQSAATASGAWTPSLTLPPAPTITAVAQQSLGSYKIDVAAQVNLLSYAGSSFEDATVGEWIELVGCTLAASTDYASHGTYSLKVTSRGATYTYMDTTYTDYTNWTAGLATYNASIAVLEEALTMRITTPTGTSGFAAVAAQTYSAVAQVRKATGTANAVMRFAWYNAAGTFLSYSSTATVAAVATGWTTLALNSQTAPANTAFAALQIAFTIAGVGEVFYVDQLAAANAASVIWSPGSGASASFYIERSDDSGSTWTPVLGYSRYGAGASQHPVQALISDYDRTAKMGYGVIPQYRAYTVTSGGAISAVGSCTADAYLLGTGWWLRDPLDPTRDLLLKQIDFSGSFEVKGEAMFPEGRTEALVIANDTPTSDSFGINTFVDGITDFDKIMVLLKSKRTLYVQSMTTGLGWYIRIVGDCSFEQVMAKGNGTTTVYKSFYKVSAQAIQVKPIYVQAAPNAAYDAITYTELSV